MTANPLHGQRGWHAFSIVEVVVAIGIVSFAFVALLALLPIGMNTFRKSMDISVGSQIIQRVIGDTQQTDYSLLTTTSQPLRYFDEQGNEVTSLLDSIYTVEVRVIVPTKLPNTSTLASANLATILVKISNNPGHQASPFAPNSNLPYSCYSAFVARNQSNSQ